MRSPLFDNSNDLHCVNFKKNNNNNNTPPIAFLPDFTKYSVNFSHKPSPSINLLLFCFFFGVFCFFFFLGGGGGGGF